MDIIVGIINASVTSMARYSDAQSKNSAEFIATLNK